MWIFLPSGFFSAVQHRDDPNKIMIRCRAQKHVQRLVDTVAMFSEGQAPKIVETPYPADYYWRVTITREQWAQFVAYSALGIDYTNFKNEAQRHDHPAGYMSALHRVWGELLRVQDRAKPPPKLPKNGGGSGRSDFDEFLTQPWLGDPELDDFIPSSKMGGTTAIETGVAVYVPDDPELGVGTVMDVQEDGAARVTFLVEEEDEHGEVYEEEILVTVPVQDLEIAPDEDPFDPNIVGDVAGDVEYATSGRPEPDTYENLEDYTWDGSWPEPVAGGTLRGR